MRPAVDSRTLIKKVITFDAAPRIGYDLPDPWPCDVVHASMGADPNFVERRWTEGNTECYIDEWGCQWRAIGTTSKRGEVFRGAITDWAQLDAYRPPDYGVAARYERARKAFAAAKDKYRIGGIPGCAFNISRYIRRLDTFLADCLLEPAQVRRLNGCVMDEIEKAVRHLAAAGADAVMFPEDWGTQDRLLTSPKTFRELFLPELQRLCRVAREVGVDVWMHSCGNVWDIIEDLIGAGIRVLQFDQPSLHGIERLDAAFGGRVALECPVDIQRTLQTRSARKIRDEAKRLCTLLGGHGGGFISCRYGDEKAIGLEPKWQDIASDAFVKFGGHQNPS
jgi:hypothetical protein